jgi:KAP-like P-loop domain-containing protein
MIRTSTGYDSAQLQRYEDDLDRWRFASEIVDVVLATPPEWSARIGIFGKWGEGKSTVLRFSESMLREHGSVVFTFNPWAIQNWNDLWENFGNNLSEALDAAGVPFNNSWKKGLKASGKWLESTGVGEIAENAVALWGKDKLYNAAFGALSRWLKYDGDQIHSIRQKLGKQRLVVLIDDLDRCAPALIPQLLLSLRELLDLPGFTFILAFDDEIVAETLTEKNPAWGQGTDFLEKILDFRFHLPAVTDKQKERLTAKAIKSYCEFVPSESTDKIRDLLPNSPRKLKSLIRSMTALQPQIVRHDADELNWSDVWLAQMLRIESYRLFERLLQGETLEEEAGMIHRFKFSDSKKMSQKEDENAGLKRLMKEIDIEDRSLQKRLIQLVEAIRARASLKFRYMSELTLRPQAVTWKEFRLLRSTWDSNRRPSVLAKWMSQHASDRDVGIDDVKTEVFEASIAKRSEFLQQAAEANLATEQDGYLLQASALLEMLEQFLLNLDNLSSARFTKVYGQFTQWVGFRINPGDRLQRNREEELVLKLLSAASNEISIEVFEELLPHGWDLDVGDGTRELRKVLREKCEAIVAPRAAAEAVQFMARDGAIRSLTEPGRFPAVKYCLFDSRSPVWKNELRNKLLSLVREGRENNIIYENVQDYMDLIVRGLRQVGIDAIGTAQLKDLIKDEELVGCVWSTLTCKQIQYRMQMKFIQARQTLLDNGALEAKMQLTPELQARLELEVRKTAAPNEALAKSSEPSALAAEKAL